MSTYKQEVTPNLNTAGNIGYCLAFVEAAFNAPHEYPYAYNAWEGTEYKHEDQSFPAGCDVPIWFSYVVNGVDEGHVCVQLSNGKILSSPWEEGTTQATLDSIDQLIQIYSDNGTYEMKYLGWSEDLNGLRIVEEVTTPAPAAAASTPVASTTGGTATVIRTVYVRTEPNTSAPLGGSEVLQPGDTFAYKAKVQGQLVDENGVSTDIWYESDLGHYCWAGNVEG